MAKPKAKVSPKLSSIPPKSFHLFVKLPVELRARIWSYSLPQPRIVPIRCETIPTSEPTATASGPPARFSSSAPIPANLHACRESRSEALREYRPWLGTAQHPGNVFLNPREDFVYLGGRGSFRSSRLQLSSFVEHVNIEQLSRIRRLAVNEAVIWDREPPPAVSIARLSARLSEYLELILSRFSGLERLVFVRHEDNPVYSLDSVLTPENGGDMRLRRRLLDAIAKTRDRCPGITFPPWDIMDISAVPVDHQNIYDESILGYISPPCSQCEHDDGLESPPEHARTRTPWFKEVMLRKLEELEKCSSTRDYTTTELWVQQPLIELRQIES